MPGFISSYDGKISRNEAIHVIPQMEARGWPDIDIDDVVIPKPKPISQNCITCAALLAACAVDCGKGDLTCIARFCPLAYNACLKC